MRAKLPLRPLTWALCAALCLWAGPMLSELQAYPGEEKGFEGIAWGSSAVQVFRARPGLKRRGYRRYAVAAAARKQKDGVFMDEVSPLFGFDEAEIRYLVGPKGLFQVEVSLQDMGAGASLSGKKAMELLVQRHGAASTDPEGRWVWAGEATVLSLEEKLSMSGSHLQLVYTRRSRWTPVPLIAPPAPAKAAPTAPPEKGAPSKVDKASPQANAKDTTQRPADKKTSKKAKPPANKESSDDLLEGADPAELMSGERP